MSIRKQITIGCILALGLPLLGLLNSIWGSRNLLEHALLTAVLGIVGFAGVLLVLVDSIRHVRCARQERRA